MRAFRDIAYGPCDMQKLNIYLPENDTFDVIVWCHGGGLEFDSRLGAERFVHAMTEKGIALVSVEYRMYPTARFPEFILDAANAAAWVQKHIGEYGTMKRFYLSGQSAGAYITMMLCMNPDYLRNAGVDRNTIDGFIIDSAQQTTHFNVLRERGLDKRLERIDEASPIYHITPETTFSRLLLLYYTNDMPGRIEQNNLLYFTLKRLVPNADVQMVLLEGEHCQGSTKANPDGTFDYVEQVVKFLE